MKAECVRVGSVTLLTDNVLNIACSNLVELLSYFICKSEGKRGIIVAFLARDEVSTLHCKDVTQALGPPEL